MPDISIIIRSKNEEVWLAHCLSMLFRQDYDDYEVILVDNASSDNTLEVAKRFPLIKIISIERFKPGYAINEGIRSSSGQYIVCLSAHCIPKSTSWLTSLRGNFYNNSLVAGVYGRQLPVSFTDPIDKRDLLIVFGLDRRVQEKDYFFHNANSMFRRDIWERYPFDEEVTNIEDRVWGKTVIDAGYKLVYDPEAAVYHHHGLHQGNISQRVKGVVSIIEKVDDDVVNELPYSLKPENVSIAAVLPVAGSIKPGSHMARLLDNTISSLKDSKYVKNLYVLSYQKQLVPNGVQWIDRSKIPGVDQFGVDEIMQTALFFIESQSNYPNSLLYVNYDYLNRPPGIYDQLIIVKVMIRYFLVMLIMAITGFMMKIMNLNRQMLRSRVAVTGSQYSELYMDLVVCLQHILFAKEKWSQER